MIQVHMHAFELWGKLFNEIRTCLCLIMLRLPRVLITTSFKFFLFRYASCRFWFMNGTEDNDFYSHLAVFSVIFFYDGILVKWYTMFCLLGNVEQIELFLFPISRRDVFMTWMFFIIIIIGLCCFCFVMMKITRTNRNH